MCRPETTDNRECLFFDGCIQDCYRVFTRKVGLFRKKYDLFKTLVNDTLRDCLKPQSSPYMAEYPSDAGTSAMLMCLYKYKINTHTRELLLFTTKNILLAVAVVVLFATLPITQSHFSKRKITHFVATDIDGNEVKFTRYDNSVIMVVNVASECSLTDHFIGLQAIYERYRDQGFVVLGFPSNSFKQEPLDNKRIKIFCTDEYLVDFPLFEKIDVIGPDMSPLYKFLTEPRTNPRFPGPVTWNFEKFLIDRNGDIVARFSPETPPEAPEVITAIEKTL